MKTTIDLPDRLFKQVRALAKRRGKSLKQVFVDALQRVIVEAPTISTTPEWLNYFGTFKASRTETLEIQRYIDAELSGINPRDWE